MTEEIYIVYIESDYDDYDANTDTKEAFGFSLRFFTNYDAAKKCADFCNLKESVKRYEEHGYKVATLKRGDNVAYDALIAREKERLDAERKEYEEKMSTVNKKHKLEKYAELIAEFEGGDKWEIYRELADKHGVDIH